MDDERAAAERYGWAIGFLLLSALSIPWFLWGSDRVVAGLPVWVWWHAAWMVVASVAFRVFTRRGWGVWIVGPQRAAAIGEETADERGERP